MQRKIYLLASAVLLASTSLADAATIHVPGDQPTIQGGINAAASGDTVLVMPGTYTGILSAVAGKPIVLMSAGGSSVTALVGSGDPIIGIDGVLSDTFVIKGFEMRNPYGRGVASTGALFRVQDCDFTGNAGGFCIHFSGGSSRGIVRGNRFSWNQTAIYADNYGRLVATRNVFEGTPQGVTISSGTASVVNNTFVGCGKAVSLPGLGGFVSGKVYNNIFYGSTVTALEGDAQSPSHDYNDYFLNHQNYNGIGSDSHGLSADPLFLSVVGGDYHLGFDSPCMDAGDPDPQYNDPDGSRNDIGAYFLFHVFPYTVNPNLGPENPARVISHVPRFYWSYEDTLGPQTGCEIQVGTDTLWDVAEMWSSGQVASSDTSRLYSGAPLIDGTTYYWRIRVSNGVSWGDWHQAWFHLNSRPSAPTSNKPVAASLVRFNAIRLFVNNSTDGEADPLTYDFQIFSDPSLTALVGSQTGIPQTTSPTSSNVFPPLTVGIQYWWRARASDGFEYSDWSSAESFVARTGTITVPTERATIALGVGEAWDGDTVLIAHGTYSEQVNPLGKAVVIEGTLPAESTIVTKPSDGADIVSIISGEGSGTVIRDLTIFGAVGANGVRIAGSSPQLLNNIIKSNAASVNGGGILIQSGNPTVRGNQILSNTAIGKGGGVFLAGGASAYIDSNSFFFNSSTDGGGAIAKIGTGSLIVTRNIIYKNSNTDDWGGIIYTEQSPNYLIEGNTIVGNTAVSLNGAGITSIGPQGGEIRNNIIAFNDGGYGIYVLVSGGTAPQLTYNDLWSNQSGGCFGVTPGTGNVSADPLLCDTTAHDFRVATGSPCLGTGLGGSNIGAMGLGCSFTGPQPPTISGLVVDHPNNQNRLVNHTPLLTWRYHDPGSRPHTKSEIQVGTDNDWSVAEMWQPPVMTGPDTSIQYAGAPLVDGSTYWVRARVRSDTAWSDWLAVSFHMNAPPSAPVLLSPIQDSIVHMGRPTLRIGLNSSDPDGDPVYYSFEVYRDSGLTLLADFMPLVWAASWTTDSLTAENQRHWWRARASDGYENGPWSTVQTFWVDAYNQPPAVFNLQSPSDGANVTDLTPIFLWDGAVDPDPGASLTYTLTIGLNPGFTFKSEVSGISDTTFHWTDSLTLQSTYWWKVKADDGRGGTVTSAVRSFKAASLCDCPHQGDLAQSGFIDVQDVLKVIGIAFVNGTDVQDPQCPKTRGDVNNSGAVDVNDVLYIIKTAFTNGPNPINPCGP